MTVQHPCISLFESVGRDEDVYAELLDVFLEDAPPRVNAIRRAVEAGDVSTLAREAHTYKGAIAEQLARQSATLFETIRRYRSALAAAA